MLTAMEEQAREIVQMLQSNPAMLSQVLAGMANSQELDFAVPGAVREEEVPDQQELSGGPLSDSDSSASDDHSAQSRESSSKSSAESDASSDVDEVSTCTSKQQTSPSVQSVKKAAGGENRRKSSKAQDTSIELKDMTAEDLLKKGSKGRIALMYTMRKAAKEAGIYGLKTLKEASAKQRNWLFKRAYKPYPALRSHERELDVLIRRMLINAKYTKKRTRTQDQESEKRTPCVPPSVPSQPKASPKKKAASTVYKALKKAKSSPSKQRKDICYLQSILKFKSRKSQEVKKSDRQDQWPSPGELVQVLHSGEVIASANFICKENNMYGRMGFVQHEDGKDTKEIDLAEPVAANNFLGRGQKMLFNQLESGDQFLWKVEKLSPVSICDKELDNDAATTNCKIKRSSGRSKTRTDRLVGHM